MIKKNKMSNGVTKNNYQKIKLFIFFVCAVYVFFLCNFSYAGADQKKAEAYLEEGNNSYNKGDLKKAKDQYQKAILAYPDHVTVHYNLAVTHVELGEIEEAIKEYKEVIRLNPQDAVVHNNLGNLYAEQKNIDLAMLEFNQAIKLAPQSPLAHNSLGDLYYKQGKYEEAVKEFQEAVRLAPTEIYGYNNLGNTYYKMGRYDDAVTQYNIALEIDPRIGYVLTNKAQAYIKKGNYAFALSCLNQVLKVDVNNAMAYNLLGDVNVLRGETDDAIANYKKTIAIKKAYAEVYYKLGRLYARTDTNESLKCFKEYLKYGKDPKRISLTEKNIKLLENKK